jgi:branched-chain amino acid transport system permease protein
MLPLIATGLAIGSLYGLIAFGLVLLLKATHTFNYAQFQVITLGAYIAYSLMSFYSFSFLSAISIAGMVGFMIGILMYYLVIKRMTGYTLFAVFVATVGMYLMLKSVMAMIWGYNDHWLPISFGQTSIQLGGGVAVSLVHIIILFITLAFIGIFIVFFNRTLLGTQMRAVSNDPETAHMMGININKVYIVSWGIATLSAAIAGVFLSALETVNVNLSDVGMKAFPVVILGGMESIVGAIVGGLILGITEVLASYFFGSEYRNAVVFSLLILILMVKPTGLFGERHSERV